MQRWVLFLFCFVLMSAFGAAAWAGDEDTKEEKPAVEAKVPEDTALPKEAEAPEPTVTEPEKPIPVLEETNAPPKKKAARSLERDPDDNIDYSGVLSRVNAFDPPAGVLAPALGFRGYRPNMIAVGVGDRTPGYGALVEYSWNRVGAGIFGSYLNHHGEDKAAASSGFFGIYGLYRWLPFDFSPYFLLGAEAGSQTDETYGALLGLGVEVRIFEGVTGLFGWTHHGTARRGYLGGALGWSF